MLYFLLVRQVRLIFRNKYVNFIHHSIVCCDGSAFTHGTHLDGAGTYTKILFVDYLRFAFNTGLLSSKNSPAKIVFRHLPMDLSFLMRRTQQVRLGGGGGG